MKKVACFDNHICLDLIFALLDIYHDCFGLLRLFSIHKVEKMEFMSQSFMTIVHKYLFRIMNLITTQDEQFLFRLNEEQRNLLSIFWKQMYHTTIPMYKILQYLYIWKQNPEEINVQNIARLRQELAEQYPPISEEANITFMSTVKTTQLTEHSFVSQLVSFWRSLVSDISKWKEE